MAIIKRYNPKNDTTYVYESVSYWDKEKKQSCSKRKLIGKVDPETGETVPTGSRGRKPKSNSPVVDGCFYPKCSCGSELRPCIVYTGSDKKGYGFEIHLNCDSCGRIYHICNATNDRYISMNVR